MQKSSVTDYLFVSFFEVKNQNTYTQDFINAVNSVISQQDMGIWDGKETYMCIFQNKCYFPILFCPIFLGMSKNVLNF